jgi:hypothetical protein
MFHRALKFAIASATAGIPGLCDREEQLAASG